MVGHFFSSRLLYFRLLGVLIWLGLWQILNPPITPFSVFIQFIQLLNFDTLKIVLFTFILVLSGFLVAYLAGAILAFLAYKFIFIRMLADPIIYFCKSTPVVVIIMALLLYFTPVGVGFAIIIITVSPICYLNTLTALENMNRQLEEVALVFGANNFIKLFYVYIPQILPELFSSANIGIGFAFKSAIAAQVIAITSGSIGEQIYFSKLYIDTNSVLAWLLIVLLLGGILQFFVNIIFSTKTI
ncbi:MAG: ABC transporter permease subunit [Bifidobacteriaceae bacterium]|nr:ABC transporter permease subunit [Bifidobacteriaceae bacterium]